MRALFFDTETTGKWNFRAGEGHICQPDMVQLAALLMDTETREEVCGINLIVQPTKPVEAEAAEVHGITNEKIENFGVSRRVAIGMFHNLLKQTDLLVAHNTDFDTRVMRHAYLREGLETPQWRTFCTMKTATEICGIRHEEPKPWHKDPFKWPKLIEAYKVLVDPEGFEGAHDALVDVRACSKVFFALQEKGIAPCSL